VLGGASIASNLGEIKLFAIYSMLLRKWRPFYSCWLINVFIVCINLQRTTRDFLYRTQLSTTLQLEHVWNPKNDRHYLLQTQFRTAEARSIDGNGTSVIVVGFYCSRAHQESRQGIKAGTQNAITNNYIGKTIGMEERAGRELDKT
jgi:hypothetical protein